MIYLSSYYLAPLIRFNKQRIDKAIHERQALTRARREMDGFIENNVMLKVGSYEPALRITS